MQIEFYKYEGTGNDFVVIDNRLHIFPKENLKLIAHLCNRRFGIGADGLLLLESEATADFRMVYFNSDGNQSSMCGNGGRCIVAFAKSLGLVKNQTNFIAIDGLHHATISKKGIVSLQMKDVTEVKLSADFVFLDTGSPHHIQEIDNLEIANIKELGATIRHSGRYGNSGTNVNFVKQISQNHFAIRTYERGVEDETLSCGTGATATAIAMFEKRKTKSNTIQIQVQGGNLEISFDKIDGVFKNIFLTGPAIFVFQGTINA